ncbi:hypothetical protein [Gordonia polyisoprenivorans]|uniref:hypothetical protein n=1 Tax=Gordonia polyisoprenivorans TaxID=84595 RepID=UPI000B99D99F|nr:hypothetical protein [Gordonia polyisoprenivorans]OZC31214.1 hypothetical protein CJJ17_06815 [Gordonia polyisoprenivorans]
MSEHNNPSTTDFDALDPGTVTLEDGGLVRISHGVGELRIPVSHLRPIAANLLALASLRELKLLSTAELDTPEARQAVMDEIDAEVHRAGQSWIETLGLGDEPTTTTD